MSGMSSARVRSSRGDRGVNSSVRTSRSSASGSSASDNMNNNNNGHTITRRVSRSNSPEYTQGIATGSSLPGLRGLVQQRFLNDVFLSTSDKHPGWKVLVVDDHAMRVISAAVGMYDIMERKITLVESLDKKRAPFPDLGVIYLVESCVESVRKIIADFSGPKPLYGSSVFLFFLRPLTDELLNEIKRCLPLLKHVKALSEVNIDFLAKEERAFDLNLKDSFTAFYLRKSMTPVELIVAEKLVTVCATLNEYPHIRYRQSSGICTSLANLFHLKMNDFVSQNASWWYHGGSSSNNSRSQQGAARRERGTLLLLDRADDCLTPLMHDFTYQSMVRDLLHMDGDRITYQAEKSDDPTKTEARDVLLDEKDSIWVELRGKHIAAVIETLSGRIREITSSATGSTFSKKASRGGNMSLKEMANALKALPDYREVLSKLSQHMHLAHQCMDVFTKEKLLELSDFEQTLATGKDYESRTPKLANVMDTAERLLMNTKGIVPKMRLILILTISQGGLRPQDRRRLFSVAQLSQRDMMIMDSLETLGLSTVAATSKKSLISLPAFNRGGVATDDEGEYASSRFSPPLKSILEELINNGLSFDDYPSVLPMPDTTLTPSTTSPSTSIIASVRSSVSSSGGDSGARSSARTSRRGEASSARRSTGPTNRWSRSIGLDNNKRGAEGGGNFSGGRSIVFVVGGMSYLELKASRDVMMNKTREIVMGSTCFISPSDFVNDLKELGADDV